MEQTLTWWQIIVTAIGALGGLELLKWIFNRKTDSRIAETEADNAEFHHLQEMNEWLQKQLQAKEERFAEQTRLLREQNREILELTTRQAEKDIGHTTEVADLRIEMVKVRCDRMECPFREPPNAFTPPGAGITADDKHDSSDIHNP